MSKRKSKGPNWASAAAPAGNAARASTPVARAAEALHRAVGAFLAQPGLQRLVDHAPIEVELREARECASSGVVDVAVGFEPGKAHPRELFAACGPFGFQQLVTWLYARSADDVDGTGTSVGDVDAPPLVLRDAQLMLLELLPVRELAPAERRLQLGESFVLDGVPHGLLARHVTHRRAGLAPDIEELQALAEVVESLTRALGDPAFEALPYDLRGGTCTRLVADGSIAEVDWPDLSPALMGALLAAERGVDLWDDVGPEPRLALERRACALASEHAERHGRTLVVTDQFPENAAPDDLGALVFLEPGTLRELARREIGPIPESERGAAPMLVRMLELVFDVLEGNTAGGPNTWPGGAPKHLINELIELQRPLDELLGAARAKAELEPVDVEHSETASAAAGYLTACERLRLATESKEVDRQQLEGALAYIEHRSEHVEGGWEAELLAFLDDERVEDELMQGGIEEGRIAGAESFRILRAVAEVAGEAPWLPAKLDVGELPTAFERGFAAWVAAAPDFFVREPNGETFLALGAGTTGVRVTEDTLDDLPLFKDEAVLLWRASLGAIATLAPGGRPLPVADARALLASVEARHGSPDDAARRASAALLVRATFVR
jgi:hypothetical protein